MPTVSLRVQKVAQIPMADDKSSIDCSTRSNTYSGSPRKMSDKDIEDADKKDCLISSSTSISGSYTSGRLTRLSEDQDIIDESPSGPSTIWVVGPSP